MPEVRAYERTENGRREQVREHFVARRPSGWIPEDKWLAGQREWEARGEAAWRKRYDHPDHARLIDPSKRIRYHDPATHPFFKNTPVSADNIVTAWDSSSDQQKVQGMHWYADAHRIAAAIAGGDADQGGAVLSVYSPQTDWPSNLFNASRAFEEHRALGPGDGMITHDRQEQARRILAGEDPGAVITNPKTRHFWKLISHGGDHPDDRMGHVVVDRHALSVAAGHRVTDKEYGKFPKGQERMYEHVADQYRIAAHRISAKEGRLVTPHQVQAATWLWQQQANQAEDQARAAAGDVGASRLAKGRSTRTRNDWKRWTRYSTAHHLPTSRGTTGLTRVRMADGSVLVLASRQEEGGSRVAEPATDPAPPAHWKGPGQWRSHAEAVQGGEPEEDEDESDSVGLASVRPYERTVRGRVEHVHGYQSRAERSLLNGWIPEPKWKEGQEHWATKGEAIWKAHEWKSHDVDDLKPGDFVEFQHPQSGRAVRGVVRAVNRDEDDTLRLDVEHKQEVPRPYDLPTGKKHSKERREITEEEARGNSRPVSHEDFQLLAAAGNRMIDVMKRDASPPVGLTDHWADIKAQAWKEVQKPWGGMTIDSHTGVPVEDGADRYAMSVKPARYTSVSVPEDATQEQFDAAMDEALRKFEPVLARKGYHLGIFHDDDVKRIDIDPVAVVDSPYQVEAIGAYAHSIGGAYHFATGNGYFPPHVDENAEKHPMERTVVKLPVGSQVTASVQEPAHFELPHLHHAEPPAATTPSPRGEQPPGVDLRGKVAALAKELTPAGDAGWNPDRFAALAADGGPDAEMMRRNEVVRKAGKMLDEELQRRLAAASTAPGEQGMAARFRRMREIDAQIQTIADTKSDLWVKEQRLRRSALNEAAHNAGFTSLRRLQARMRSLQAWLKSQESGTLTVDGAVMTADQVRAEVTRLNGVLASAKRQAVVAAAPLVAQMRQLTAQRAQLQEEKQRLGVLDQSRLREEAIKLLQEARGDQFGGPGLVYQGRTRYTEQFSKPNPRAEAAMRWAESNYPQSWLSYARQHGGPTGYSLLAGAKRGDYTDIIRRIRLSEDTSQVQLPGAGPSGNVATHELGHVMEQSVPGLVQLEQAEIWRRTSTGSVGSRTIDPSQPLNGYTGELGRPDKFPLPYSGKDYADGGAKVADSYELFTTGAQSLMAGSLYLDDEFRQWVLGVMALLGREQAPSAQSASVQRDDPKFLAYIAIHNAAVQLPREPEFDAERKDLTAAATAALEGDTPSARKALAGAAAAARKRDADLKKKIGISYGEGEVAARKYEAMATELPLGANPEVGRIGSYLETLIKVASSSFRKWDPVVARLLSSAAAEVKSGDYRGAWMDVMSAANMVPDKHWARAYRSLASRISALGDKAGSTEKPAAKVEHGGYVVRSARKAPATYEDFFAWRDQYTQAGAVPAYGRARQKFRKVDPSVLKQWWDRYNAESPVSAPRAQQLYYHGTRRGPFKPGDILEGGHPRSSMSNPGKPHKHVFFHSDIGKASGYADTANWEEYGKGTPAVYQVEPVGQSEMDPDMPAFSGAMRARKVRVVRRVPWQSAELPLHDPHEMEAKVLRDHPEDVSPQPDLLSPLRKVFSAGEQVVEEAARPAVTGLVTKAAAAVPDLFGSGHYLAWDGKQPSVFPDNAHPLWTAYSDWEGHVHFSQSVADGIARALRNGKVDDPDAFATTLHELVHLVLPVGHERGEDAADYVKGSPEEEVEEGFTELASSAHAAEFFDRIGIGALPTPVLARGPDGKEAVNPAYAKKLDLALKAMRRAEAAYRFLRNTSAAKSVDTAVYWLESGDYHEALATLHKLEKTDPATARALRQQIGDLSSVDRNQHATARELATSLAAPEQLREGKSWGHYAPWSANAYSWAEEVARLRGHPGDAQFVRQLIDQVASVGAASKIPVMAGQLVAALEAPKDQREWLTMMGTAAVRDMWKSHPADVVARQVTDRLRKAMRGAR